MVPLTTEVTPVPGVTLSKSRNGLQGTRGGPPDQGQRLSLPALSPVSAWHDTALGRVEVQWSLEAGQVTCNLALPAGMTARMDATAKRRALRIDGQAVAQGTSATIAAGRHVIEFAI